MIDVEEKEVEQIRLEVTTAQLQRIRTIYDISDELGYEVMVLGKVSHTGGPVLRLDELIIPKQTSSSMDCEIDRGWLAKMIMEGKYVNFWFHTHPGMSAFWSTIDESTARSLSGKAAYFVSLVMGEKHETLVRMDINEPVPATIPVSLEISVRSDKEIYDSYLKEITTKVKMEEIVSKPGNIAYPYQFPFAGHRKTIREIYDGGEHTVEKRKKRQKKRGGHNGFSQAKGHY